MASANVETTQTLQSFGDGSKLLFVSATGNFEYGFGATAPAVLHDYEKEPNAIIVIPDGLGKFWYKSDRQVTVKISESV